MFSRVVRLLFPFVAAAAGSGLSGCGADRTPSGFPRSSTLAQQCNSVDTQRRWVRSYMDEVYLWYREIPQVDASLFSTPQDYFKALLVRTPTTSGRPRDRFSRTVSTEVFQQFINAGVEASYGIEWAIVPNTRIVRVAYTEPSSPAASANVKRGATVLGVNGQDINTMPGRALVDALFPSQLQVQTDFQFRDVSGSTRTVTLTSDNVTKTPVPLAPVLTTTNGKVGYLVFNEHVATAESQLVQAIGRFNAERIDALVLDLRYNRGGYLYIAEELASMILGDSQMGKPFEKLKFNDNRTSESRTYPFVSTTRDNQPLPKLGLGRVFVLTSGDTCSASESVINGLAPYIEVVRIGGTTCGKPYGFLGKDNCGTLYLPVEFQGVNAADFGDYADGFAPTCSARDDLEHEQGDQAEGMLAAALAYRANGTCQPPFSVAENALRTEYEDLGSLNRPPLRILTQ